MNLSARIIIVAIGIIICAGGAVNSSREYLILRYIDSRFEAMESSYGTGWEKDFRQVLGGHPAEDLVIKAFNTQIEQGVALRKTLQQIVGVSKRHAIINVTLYLIMFLLFSVLLIKK